ncbi:RNA polymerase Rpb4-domain-containing protein [Amylostereum chailletii]|nr:RNA polymerase Rpb4-domain-containing protein [Amylostereum chailletii]
MEVLNPRASLLSNFEVLSLLRELESDFHLKSKTAQRVKKEDEAAGVTTPRVYDPLDDISENLRTVEVEAIQYLSAAHHPIGRQTAQGISKLVKDLAPYGLTKSEKLQVVNLAPTEAVELYVIVEELEDRLGERMEEVLSAVHTSLLEAPAQNGVVNVADGPEEAPSRSGEPIVFGEGEQWEEEVTYDEFLDAGEGAGIEGDLDMEED